MPITIDKPSKYFNTVTYTGNGSARSLTGVNFKPDFVWIKSRSSASWWHQWQDIVRGATKRLASNDTATEATDVQTLTSFDTDGFSLGTSTSYNNNADTYVAWNWLGANTTASNTAGSISSTVSANTTSGFSVVSYTGTGANATVGHGLGVAPKMIIFKSRNSATSWVTYHASLGATNFVALSNTDASSASSLPFNNTAPTSSVFSLGTSGGTNSTSMIAYCFSEVKGFSKAFSYTGNGSTDGTYVHLGFRPAFVMLKSSSSGSVGWITHDNKRIGFNPNNYYVEPNNSNAESADTDKILLLSNGFKLISTSASWNSSGGTYIGFAVAESPFVSSKGVPVCAR